MKPTLRLLVIPITLFVCLVTAGFAGATEPTEPSASNLRAAMAIVVGMSAPDVAETEASPFLPPGHGSTPPGQGGTPPGQTTPPGQGGTPPGQDGTPPGQNDPPPGDDDPPPADD